MISDTHFAQATRSNCGVHLAHRHRSTARTAGSRLHVSTSLPAYEVRASAGVASHFAPADRPKHRNQAHWGSGWAAARFLIPGLPYS